MAPPSRRRRRRPDVDPTDGSTWPEICPDCGTRLTRTRQCLAHIRKGERAGQHCTRVAGVGLTVCAAHGAKNPTAKAAGLARQVEAKARKDLARFGMPEVIDAHTAIERELHRCCGNVAWIEAQIHQLAPESGEDMKADALTADGKPSPLMVLYWQERDRLARTSRACIELGIEERRVRIAEEQADFVMRAVAAALSELDVDMERAGPVLARHLRALPAVA